MSALIFLAIRAIQPFIDAVVFRYVHPERMTYVVDNQAYLLSCHPISDLEISLSPIALPRLGFKRVFVSNMNGN